MNISPGVENRQLRKGAPEMKDAKAENPSVARNEGPFRLNTAAIPKKQGFPRRAKDTMVPLSAFVSRINESQTAAEAVETILLYFNNPLGNAGSPESLHRSILVVNEQDKVVGVLNFSDILKSLQRPSIRLLQKEQASSAPGYAQTSGRLNDFAIMVRERATKKIRELLPQEFPFIDENSDLMEATEKLFSLKVNSLLVVQNNEPVGILRQKDLFLEAAKIMNEHRWETKPG
jgi:CBS domain-containing protein